ncbi:MAG: hypothetical protein HYU34_04095 [Candidatus Omnitrophica bacterium]|nr:hypothetical protein [Candidatus Omnitrophota bacterium]
MITSFWLLNLAQGFLLALIAATVTAELKSSSLVPKSLLLWPLFVIVFGALNLFVGGLTESFFRGFLGAVLVLCGIQAGLVNLRRLAPWPSGAVWLGLALAGAGFQFYPLFLERVMGFVWMAVGLDKVIRERSASLESGTPVWIFLLYLQAVILASSR